MRSVVGLAGLPVMVVVGANGPAAALRVADGAREGLEPLEAVGSGDADDGRSVAGPADDAGSSDGVAVGEVVGCVVGWADASGETEPALSNSPSTTSRRIRARTKTPNILRAKDVRAPPRADSFMRPHQPRATQPNSKERS